MKPLATCPTCGCSHDFVERLRTLLAAVQGWADDRWMPREVHDNRWQQHAIMPKELHDNRWMPRRMPREVHEALEDCKRHWPK